MADKKRELEIQKKIGVLSALVIDDSRFDRELIAAMLIKIGLSTIQTAENGHVAQGKLKTALAIRKPYDLIFLDSQMPLQDGLHLLQWMRQDSKLSDQMVIITSGTADLKAISNFIELGAKGFVVKPIKFEILKEKILSALNLEIKNAG